MSIKHINPMVRAVATMGAIAALVGGVTFAALTSNAVALTPNNMTVASASLVIGPGPDCTDVVATSTTGLHESALTPGASATPVSFCIKNTGGVPLNLSAVIPEAITLATDTAAQNITFGINCGTYGSPTTTLSSWSPETFGGGALPAGATVDCSATASLASTYTEGGHVVPGFSVQFTGVQP
jgi:hypothetical protein